MKIASVIYIESWGRESAPVDIIFSDCQTLIFVRFCKSLSWQVLCLIKVIDSAPCILTARRHRWLCLWSQVHRHWSILQEWILCDSRRHIHTWVIERKLIFLLCDLFCQFWCRVFQILALYADSLLDSSLDGLCGRLIIYRIRVRILGQRLFHLLLWYLFVFISV